MEHLRRNGAMPEKPASSSIIRIAALVLLALVTASCGTEAITSPDDDRLPTTPTCAQGDLAVAAILDGVAMNDRISNGYPHAFINKLGAGPGTFDAGSGSVVVHLEWGVLVANGQSTPALGWVRGAGFDVGNPSSAAFSGTIFLDDGAGFGGHFLLRELHHAPYGSGAAVRGAVAGCFRN